MTTSETYTLSLHDALPISVSNAKGITVPLVIISNTGHYFVRPDEILYDNAISHDKTIAFEEGAVHGGTQCRSEERRVGKEGRAGWTSYQLKNESNKWVIRL